MPWKSVIQASLLHKNYREKHIFKKTWSEFAYSINSMVEVMRLPYLPKVIYYKLLIATKGGMNGTN